MDILVEQYINTTFHPELGSELIRSFELLNAYELQDYEMPLLDAVMDSANQEPSTTQDIFMSVLMSKLDYVLNAHTIKLSDEATLREKNEFLDAFRIIQDYDDFVSIIRLLESDIEPDEKLAAIVSQLSNLSASDVIRLLESFDVRLLEKLMQFIYAKEKETENTVLSDDETNIIDNLRIFKEFVGERQAVGLELFNSSVLLGRPLTMYLPFILDVIKNSNDHEQLAMDIYSILLLTKEGLVNPIAVFRDHNHEMLDNLTTVTQVDVQLTKLVGEFERFKLSKASTNQTTHISGVGNAT